MVVGGKGDDEAECPILEVLGPVELVVLVGAKVEKVLLDTVDAGVVGAGMKMVVCCRTEDVVDRSDVDVAVG